MAQKTISVAVCDRCNRFLDEDAEVFIVQVFMDEEPILEVGEICGRCAKTFKTAVENWRKMTRRKYVRKSKNENETAEATEAA